MKTAFFFVFIAFILACGLVFCEEYKTEVEYEDKTGLEDEYKTEFENEDKTEFDDESAEVEDPYRRRCKSSKNQYQHLVFYFLQLKSKNFNKFFLRSLILLESNNFREKKVISLTCLSRL